MNSKPFARYLMDVRARGWLTGSLLSTCGPGGTPVGSLGGLDVSGFGYYCGAVALVLRRGEAATLCRSGRSSAALDVSTHTDAGHLALV